LLNTVSNKAAGNSSSSSSSSSVDDHVSSGTRCRTLVLLLLLLLRLSMLWRLLLLLLLLLLQGREHGSFLVRLQEVLPSRQRFIQELQDNADQHFELRVRGHGLGCGVMMLSVL
jgi:hypothetical protein